MDFLLGLPNELLLEIGSYLPRTGDVHSLVITNRRLHCLLKTRLYQAPSQHLLWRVVNSRNIAAFRRILDNSLDAKVYLRDIVPMLLLDVVWDATPVRLEMLRRLLSSGAIDIEEWRFSVTRGSNYERCVMEDLFSSYGVRRFTKEGLWLGYKHFMNWGWLYYEPKRLATEEFAELSTCL
jgi:hypothetical protein